MTIFPTDKSLLNNTDGGWSEWNEWSSCSRDCNGGIKWRHRHCTNPAPLGEGLDCLGHAKEGKDCNTHSCQGMHLETWEKCEILFSFMLYDDLLNRTINSGITPLKISNWYFTAAKIFIFGDYNFQLFFFNCCLVKGIKMSIESIKPANLWSLCKTEFYVHFVIQGSNIFTCGCVSYDSKCF